MLPSPWYFWLGRDADQHLEAVRTADGWSFVWRDTPFDRIERDVLALILEGGQARQ